ncbi:MAG: hypothetical protein E6Q97_38530 [Desulfurellales bacterium]|nr:MAG: hypothetical protein E6Q97_38530 [Desulfurellales bacterium]
MKRSIVLNKFDELAYRDNLKPGQVGPAKGVRYTITVSATPVLTSFDAKTLGAGPAAAIRDHLKERIDGIGTKASPATIKKRKAAAAGPKDAEAASMAAQRYAPGRGSVEAPGTYDRLFKDSGRLVAGIAVAARGNSWLINVPGNRLDPRTLGGGEAALIEIYALLRRHVPEIANPALLRDVLSVRRAIRSATPLIDPRAGKIIGRELGRLGRSVGGFLQQDVKLRDVVDAAKSIYGAVA